MPETTIRVQGLGKEYEIGRLRQKSSSRQGGAGFKSLRDRLAFFHSKRRDINRFWALKDISFDVRAGDIVGLIGANGAGKSTLLKILSRITDPTCGFAEVHGRVGSLLEVGTGFHPELTGRENIFLNGAILGMKRAEIQKNFDQIVEFAEVERFLDTPVKRYSSGMYMRLAFSVAAHLTPDILVIDEVLAVGDARFQRKCLGKLEDVASKSARTVLFVTHNMSAVQALCNRVLILKNGTLIEDTRDVRHAIASYSGAAESRSCWKRAEGHHPDGAKMLVASVEATLCGEQPYHRLKLQIELQSFDRHPDVFITFDFADSSMAPVMEACPSFLPFIPASERPVTYEVEIDLPPLVPGVYSVSPWIGPAYNVKYDKVQSAVQFEIAVSPDTQRSFPHFPDHGFLVPFSRAQKSIRNVPALEADSAFDVIEAMDGQSSPLGKD